MRSIVWIIAFVLEATILQAQSVTFRAKAPGAVRMNEQFYLTYEVNQEGNNFKSGNLSAFNILGGPSQSSNSSISIINGKMEQSTTISYTYILSASKPGKFTITPGTIQIGGKTHTSNPVTIEVVKGNVSTKTEAPTTGISDKDLFVRIEVNKKSVYKGEPITASVKLYTRVQLQQLTDVKIPQFDGFWREDIDNKDQAVQWKRESYDGELYNTGIISQFLLIPQHDGTLTIDPIDLELIALQEVRQKRQHRSIFDDFFDRPSYQQVKKVLKSPPVKIKVKETPEAAEMVGNIKVQSKISKTSLKANESITLSIKLSGQGNLKTVSAPKINFPSDLEVFEPETNQNIKVTSSGISGTKTFEYLIIPRYPGKYHIPAVQLTCFNPKSGKLQKLSTKDYEITVGQGDNNNAASSKDYSRSREDIQLIGKDIRYIKTNNFALKKSITPWFGSTSFYLSYVLSSGGFILVFLYVRQRRKNTENQSEYKRRKAGKLARKRLKTAEQFLHENNRSKFYEELLKAIWKYLENKLDLHTADLSKDKINYTLINKQVSESTLNRLSSIIEKCEMARYTPAGSSNALPEDYAASVDLISSLEEEIKS